MTNLKYVFNGVARLLSTNKNVNSNHLKIICRFCCCDNSKLSEEEPTFNLKKVIKVAVLGTPNCGKSTLINKVLDRPLCPASKKVHTTKQLARATCHIDDTQIIFMDTPGVISEKEQKKYNLPGTMLSSCHIGKNTADLLAVLYDASSQFPPALPSSIIPFLSRSHPAVLIFNKVDLVKKKNNLLDLTKILTGSTLKKRDAIPKSEYDQKPKNVMFTENNRGYKGFLEVFYVSALKGHGVDRLMDYLITNALPEEDITPGPPIDMTPEDFIVETVRGKLLDFLPQEIPYRLIPEMEFYEEKPDGRIVTVVSIRCPDRRIAKLIIGSGCGRLRQIQDHIRMDLTRAFQSPVSIALQTNPKIISDLPVPPGTVPVFDIN